MAGVLMVAEKPMLAASIAKILSDNQCSSEKGFNGACSIHKWKGSFCNQSAYYKMTSTCGHVMTLDFPSKYNDWNKVDPVQLFQVPTTKKEANVKLKMPAFLSKAAQGCSHIVLWLDCDKEGENICYEVLDSVSDTINVNDIRNVHRAHFSAITDKDIKAAMKNLMKPDKNQALSVDARQELDLRIGCAFTRFQTSFFSGKYGDLDSTLISFGPCQTPTLGFLVTRHDQIQSFKPEPYWVVKVELAGGILPQCDRGRLFDREVALLVVDRVQACGKAIVEDVGRVEGSKSKPCALNTVELMRIASSGLGIGPQQCMAIAEQLYTRGYISYPRTETTTYPSNFDLNSTLRQQKGHETCGEAIDGLLKNGIFKPKKGKDVGDHPPITPMRSGEGLSGDMSRIFNYIVQHFVATLMDDCRYYTTTAYLRMGKETFNLTAKSVIDPGFTQVMSWQAIDDCGVLELKKGDVLALKSAKVDERQTSPPDYLTESELISKAIIIIKHGIGTDASIPVHINNVCQRNYAQVATGRKLIPTRLGIVLVHGYNKVDPQLVLPTMRAEVEKQLELIAKGKADFQAVKEHALEVFRLKFLYFVSNIPAVDILFEDCFTTLSESGKPFSRCGKCRRYMKLITARPQRLHCAQCQETYSVPTGEGVLRVYGEQRCPLDDFELVQWVGVGGKLSKSYALCPYCYTHPPFSEMGIGSGCSNCSHPTCPHSYSSLGVLKCPQTCNQGKGIMCLDPASGPKWRLACNQCAGVIILPEGISKVQLCAHGTTHCKICSSRLLNIHFKNGASPLSSGDLEISCCIFCHPEIKDLVNMKHSARIVPPSAGGRGRGRGRGGGRGRGRGRGISRGRGP